MEGYDSDGFDYIGSPPSSGSASPVKRVKISNTETLSDGHMATGSNDIRVETITERRLLTESGNSNEPDNGAKETSSTNSSSRESQEDTQPYEIDEDDDIGVIYTNEDLSSREEINTSQNHYCDNAGDIKNKSPTEEMQVVPKPEMDKAPSVLKDARAISDMLGLESDDGVYEKLESIRSDRNRLQKVVNILLDAETSTNMQDTLVASSSSVQQPSGASPGVSTSEKSDDPPDTSPQDKSDPAPGSSTQHKLCDESSSSTQHQHSKPDNHTSTKPCFEGVKFTERSNVCTMERLLSDVKKVLFILKGKNCKLEDLDPDEVYSLLEKNAALKDRVNVVVNIIVESKGEKEPFESTIFSDVQKVLKELPKANPDEVYELLDYCTDTSNRVTKVIAQLNTKALTKPALTRGASITANDPLYGDMQNIAAMFPDRDQNEIYAYLEAHHDRRDRVQIVMDELLAMAQGSLDEPTRPQGMEHNGAKVHAAKDDHMTIMQRDVNKMMEIFPDCDPYYLFEELENQFQDPQRVENLTAVLFDRKDYPKLKDRTEKERNNKLRKQLQEMKLDIEEFLKVFPNPLDQFYSQEKTVSALYREHALTQLKNMFPMLLDKYILEKFENNKNHFAPTVKELTPIAEKFHTRTPRPHHKSKKYRSDHRDFEELPEKPDEYFYKELCFVENEERILDYIETDKLGKEIRMKEAKEKGLLQECGCCYDDEVLVEDILTCPDGHCFCKECIRRMSETSIGDGKVKFPCLEGECTKEFDNATLQMVLAPKMFSTMLRKVQEEEIRQADITDLVMCPHCNFATIMPEEDKVFRCLNPDCLKVTCRLCQEADHVPLRCEEVEKQDETNMRTYIETKMTEAMIRTCWRCKKRFFKTEGCNKMTCTCGASMCYVCRKPIKDYDHFNDNPQCNEPVDMTTLHRKEMEAAGAEAKEKLAKDHPDLADVDLKFDPMKDLDGAGPVASPIDYQLFGARAAPFPFHMRAPPHPPNRHDWNFDYPRPRQRHDAWNPDHHRYDDWNPDHYHHDPELYHQMNHTNDVNPFQGLDDRHRHRIPRNQGYRYDRMPPPQRPRQQPLHADPWQYRNRVNRPTNDNDSDDSSEDEMGMYQDPTPANANGNRRHYYDYF